MGDEFQLIRETDIVYIAGKMSGMPMFNYPAFYGLAGIIEKEFRCEVLNPARQPNGLDYEEYMRRAMADLDRATVIVLLDSWQQSPGAKREFQRAFQRRIGILYQSQVESAVAAKLKRENPNINMEG
jgi:hypothetical protein